jgi:hypothetical protein
MGSAGAGSRAAPFAPVAQGGDRYPQDDGPWPPAPASFGPDRPGAAGAQRHHRGRRDVFPPLLQGKPLLEGQHLPRAPDAALSRPGAAIEAVLPDTKQTSLDAVLKGHVQAQSVLCSDGAHAYQKLARDCDCKHPVISRPKGGWVANAMGRVVCVKFSKLPALVMTGVGGAAPPYSAASATPGRRQAAMALSASFLRSLRCSMLR